MYVNVKIIRCVESQRSYEWDTVLRELNANALTTFCCADTWCVDPLAGFRFIQGQYMVGGVVRMHSLKPSEENLYFVILGSKNKMN